MLISRRNKPVVGLDIGANSVKMVQLDKSRGTYAVEAIAVRELPPEAIVADEIRDREAVIFNIQSVMDELDGKSRDVVVSLSGHALITDKLVIDKRLAAGFGDFLWDRLDDLWKEWHSRQK